MPLFKLGFLDAVEKSDYTLVEHYLKKNAEKYQSMRRHISKESAVNIAARNFDKKMLSLLCRYPHVELNYFYMTEFHSIPSAITTVAIANKPVEQRAEMMRFLEALGGDINYNSFEANILRFVSEQGKWDILPTLIEMGIDFSIRPSIITEMIDLNLDSDIIKAVIKNKTSTIDDRERMDDSLFAVAGDDFIMPIHHAAERGRIDLIECLLDCGADIDQPSMVLGGNDGKRAPVNFAFADCSGKTLRFLLERGADPANAHWEWERLSRLNTKSEMRKSYGEIKAVLDLYPLKNKKPTQPSPWKKLDDESIALVKEIPALERRITEIFNFKSYERTVITENLDTETESAPTVQKFSEVSDDAVQAAAEEFEKRGGTVDWRKALPSRIVKTIIPREDL